MKTLILIRGLPGSGKSTLARKMMDQFEAIHLEADMYFLDDQGQYVFDPTQLKNAHGWCYSTMIKSFQSRSVVIVSNTFTTEWELKPYLEYAEQNRINVKIYRMTKDYGSIHNVPEESIQRMRNRFQDIKGEVMV